jgi:hypothetical protein
MVRQDFLLSSYMLRTIIIYVFVFAVSTLHSADMAHVVLALSPGLDKVKTGRQALETFFSHLYKEETQTIIVEFRAMVYTN